MQRRAIEPFDAGVVALQRMEVGGALHVDPRAQRLQQGGSRGQTFLAGKSI